MRTAEIRAAKRAASASSPGVRSPQSQSGPRPTRRSLSSSAAKVASLGTRAEGMQAHGARAGAARQAGVPPSNGKQRPEGASEGAESAKDSGRPRDAGAHRLFDKIEVFSHEAARGRDAKHGGGGSTFGSDGPEAQPGAVTDSRPERLCETTSGPPVAPAGDCELLMIASSSSERLQQAPHSAGCAQDSLVIERKAEAGGSGSTSAACARWGSGWSSLVPGSDAAGGAVVRAPASLSTDTDSVGGATAISALVRVHEVSPITNRARLVTGSRRLPACRCLGTCACI